jgi:hypothetical protein
MLVFIGFVCFSVQREGDGEPMMLANMPLKITPKLQNPLDR